MKTKTRYFEFVENGGMFPTFKKIDGNGKVWFFSLEGTWAASNYSKTEILKCLKLREAVEIPTKEAVLMFSVL